MFFQLYANGGDTEGLFRAGIMSSGFSVPTRPRRRQSRVFERDRYLGLSAHRAGGESRQGCER